MNVYYFTFRSMTSAQQASSALRKLGIPVTLIRSPKAISSAGCGYAVQVRADRVLTAEAALRSSKIHFEKMFYSMPGGSMQEVLF